MAANAYNELAPPAEGSSHFDGLMRMFRVVFEPWERNPMMLEAFHRARSGSGGEQLDDQGVDAVTPFVRAVLADADPGDVEDIEQILTNVSYGLVARFVDGEVDITDILPAIELTVARLTGAVRP